MEATARNVDAALTDPVFEDGIGVRYLVTGPSGEPSGETLVIRPALAGARSFEFALRERVARLSTVLHPALPKLRAVDRTTGPDATLRLVSECAPGTRLSRLLEQAQTHQVHLDIGSALGIIRQLVGAVAALHESARDVSHGAIALERTVITPAGRVLVVEHGLGAALQQLRFSGTRYWSELHVAVPPSPGPVLFDQRVDVVQIGVIVLGLLLSRSLRDNEIPNRTADLVGEARALSLRGDVEPLPSGLRRWLTRALQLDPLRSFSSAIDARSELDALLDATDAHASMASLESFLERIERAMPEPRAHEANTPAEQAPWCELDLAGIDAALDSPGEVASISVAIALPERLALPTASESDQALLTTQGNDVVPQEHAPIELAPVEAVPEAVALTPMSATAFAVLVPNTPVADRTLPPVLGRTAGERSPVEEGAATDLVDVTDTPPDSTHLPSPVNADVSSEVSSTPAVQAVADSSHNELRVDAIDAAMDAVAAGDTVRESRELSPVSNISTPVTDDAPTESRAARSPVFRGLMAAAVPATFAALTGYAIGGGALAPVRPMSPGLVTLTTWPAGVETYVDGAYRGRTPLNLSLPPGPHAIDLQRAEAEPVSVPITLGSGMKISQFVDLPLADRFLQLAIGASTHDATVERPGRLVDTGTVKVICDAVVKVMEGDIVHGFTRESLELPVGRHDLTLIDDASGINTTRTVVVDAKRPTVVKVAMPTGVLALSATPPAEVWVDGNRRGETPIRAMTLRAGAHDVIFRHRDLGDRKQAVVVTAGDVLRVNVDLRSK